MKATLRPALLLLWACFAPLEAQSNKLAFLIPDIYGPDGLTLSSSDHYAHFSSSVQANFTPFNSAMARQLTSLPIPSPASGFVYEFDRTLGVYTRSAKSLGPILAERAETIGKDRFLFGLSYQHFAFTSIDGLDLHGVPVVFEHQPAADPKFVADIISTDNFIDAQVSQVTGFVSYGLTNRIDIALAVPVLTVKLAATSHATIQRIGTPGDTDSHTFGTPNGGTQKSFDSAGSATGIGDAIARLKGTLIKWHGGGIAAALDVRLPTGDEYNFLGSGALGAKPFLVASGQLGRFSPHLNAGYQWNGKSVLAGSVVTRTKTRLPRALVYAAGADIGATQKLTLALDVLGERVSTDRVTSRTFVAANRQTFPTIGFQKATYDILSGSAGFKINAGGRFVFTANMLFRLNHTGLRSKVVPLIGLSYTL
jgi:hypothetical protein